MGSDCWPHLPRDSTSVSGLSAQDESRSDSSTLEVFSLDSDSEEDGPQALEKPAQGEADTVGQSTHDGLTAAL